MSEFDSGNSVNCVLLEVNLYKKEGNIIGLLYLLYLPSVSAEGLTGF